MKNTLKTKSFLVSMSALALVGCSENSSTDTPGASSIREAVSSAVGAVQPPVLPKIDNSTPDFALKTWWSYLDELQAYEYRVCLKNTSELKDFGNKLEQLLTGDPLNSRKATYTCSQSKIDRQIKKVHMETETRSVIEVVMRDSVGPKPDETVPDYAKKDLERGHQYKYVLVKTPDGWRIEDVLQWSDTNVVLNRDPWNRIYKVEPKSYYFHLPYQ